MLEDERFRVADIEGLELSEDPPSGVLPGKGVVSKVAFRPLEIIGELVGTTGPNA